MSQQQPPPAGTPEYLEHGLGVPLPPESPTPGDTPRRPGRRAWWVGGGGVALLGLGAGAWAALGFFQQGAQPAEALPSSTVGYVSIDLDPSGGQKIDAFRTLNKFPAFKDEVGVSSVDQLRHKLGDELISGSGCHALDYSHDVDPWLGDRMAGAVVPLQGDAPHVVAVVQVTDDAKARAGLAAIARCSGSGDDGIVVKNGWAVLAESQQVADAVSKAATDDGTLADDATYQKWTKEVGEAGVVNAYASPDAGRVVGKLLTGFFGGTSSTSSSSSSSGTVVPGKSAPYSSVEPGYSSGLTVASGFVGDPFAETLTGFKGGAATLRFTGDGLELAMAGDGSSPALAQFTGTTGGELAGRLPDDTAAAASITLRPGWLKDRLDAASSMLLGGGDRRGLERETGLNLPDDIETLLGSGVAVSVGHGIDLEAAENTGDGTGIPVAATVKGDPGAIEAVLGRLRMKTGDPTFLGSDSSDGLVAIGPTAAYRREVLAGGHLGDQDAFTSVVPDAAHASSVLFVNMDALEPAIAKVAGEGSPDLANLEPLRAVGMSTWSDGGVTRFSLKVTTN